MLKPTKTKQAIIQKAKCGSNSIETKSVDGALYIFDHETGNQMALGFDVYGQGYTECWSNRFGFEAHLQDFRSR